MNCCSTEKEKVLIIGSRSHALDSTCLTKISLVKTNLIIKACVKRNVFFTTAKHVLDFGMKLLKPFLKTGPLIDCKFQTILFENGNSAFDVKRKCYAKNTFAKLIRRVISIVKNISVIMLKEMYVLYPNGH